MTAVHETEPTARFSNRVADYIRYRPGYPPGLVAWLREAIDLQGSWFIADIGSGTGLLSQVFLDNGNLVYGIEPNAAMRAAAEETFANQPRFASIDGTAEATTLPDGAVDLVAAGQAFHWFEPAGTQREWKRILSPGGRALVVFNSRRVDENPFMRAYDAFLATHAVDYQGVDHRRVLGKNLQEFMGDVIEWHLDYPLARTYDDVRGLSLSSSYVPAPGHPKHEAFLTGLRALFDTHAREGNVEFLYRTEAYVGRPR